MEMAFEKLGLALESTPGTPITNPQTFLNGAGVIRPRNAYTQPGAYDGTLAQSRQEKITRTWGEWNMDGELDVNALVYVANIHIDAVTSPSTPGGATNSRLWEFVPNLTADDQKRGTVWWGDPNVQTLRGSFATTETLSIINDSSGEAAARMTMSGRSHKPEKVSAPTWPTFGPGADIPAMWMQVWIDNMASGSIGGTAVTGRLVRAEHVLPNPLGYKWIPAGPSGGLNYTGVGRGKRTDSNRLLTRLTLEVPDMTQFDHIAAEDVVGVRVRHNGPLIESGFYNYVEVDTYGKVRFQDWGELEGTNRTLQVEIYSNTDATLGADFRLAIQNEMTSL